jgi:hypothetical protein
MDMNRVSPLRFPKPFPAPLSLCGSVLGKPSGGHYRRKRHQRTKPLPLLGRQFPLVLCGLRPTGSRPRSAPLTSLADSPRPSPRGLASPPA